MAELERREDLSAAPEHESPQELGWILAKSLLEANARSTQALEYHLVQALHSDGSASTESMRTCIRQAIDEHERIIEHLELAEQAAADLQRADAPGLSDD